MRPPACCVPSSAMDRATSGNPAVLTCRLSSVKRSRLGTRPCSDAGRRWTGEDRGRQQSTGRHFSAALGLWIRAGRAARWVKLPYLALSKQIEGIDDPRSRYYNQLVDRSKVARVDWRTSEQMLRNDDLYKWGIVVEHNRAARPGAGSCIFLHVWKGPASPTAGCTAMPENEIVKLLRWLDPAAHPILVQMPRSSYPAFQSKFRLPKEL